MSFIFTLLTISVTLAAISFLVPLWLLSTDGDYLSDPHPWQTTLGTLVIAAAGLFLVPAGISRLVWAYQFGAVWQNPTVFSIPSGRDYWSEFLPSLPWSWSVAQTLVPGALSTFALVGVGLLVLALLLLIWGFSSTRWQRMRMRPSILRFMIFYIMPWSLVLCAILQTVIFVAPHALMTLIFFAGFWPVAIALLVLGAGGSTAVVLRDDYGNRYRISKD